MRKLLFIVASAAALAAHAAAELAETPTGVRLARDGRTVWNLEIETPEGRPFFHPLTLPGGRTLTDSRPADHVWHLGYWFSWKFINGVNYWEPADAERKGFEPAGATRVVAKSVKIDGLSCRVGLDLTYGPRGEEPVLSEKREIVVEAPDADGGYVISTHHLFTALADVTLDRSEPWGSVESGKWGAGYAGTTLRLDPALAAAFSVRGSAGGATPGECTARETKYLEFTDPATGEGVLFEQLKAPQGARFYLWPDKRMINPSVVYTGALKLKKGETLELAYRLSVRAGARNAAAPTRNQSDVVVLSNRFGVAKIERLGARVVSYVPAGGKETLAMLDSGTGGIPICFPWFQFNGPEGRKSPKHGIARYSMFDTVRVDNGADESTALFRLRSYMAEHRELFPHEYELLLDVSLGETLTLVLLCRNTGKTAFPMTMAFHPYFLRSAVPRLFNEGSGRFRTWDPDETSHTKTQGLAPDDWRKFFCVENGSFDPSEAFTLKPGEVASLVRTLGPKGRPAYEVYAVVRPTFVSCGLEIPAEPGESCLVRYWAKGSLMWETAADLVYFDTTKTWRGSITGLAEDTDYNLRIKVGDRETTTAGFRTWKSDVPVAKTVTLDPKTESFPIRIDAKGSSDGWIRYTLPEGTKLVNATTNDTIAVEGAQYVLLDDMTIEGGTGRYSVTVRDSRFVRIRNCDISRWGRNGPVAYDRKGRCQDSAGKEINFDGAITLFRGAVGTVVERCFVHDPNCRANSWFYSHPAGPEAVMLNKPDHSTVIRYCDFVGSDVHRFNDAVESWGNFHEDGGFNRDADVYGNFMIYCNDDCIELDGGQRNVRCFGNRFEAALCGVSIQGCMMSPVYVEDNLFSGMCDEFGSAGQTIKTGGGAHGTNATAFVRGNVFAGPGSGIRMMPTLGCRLVGNVFADGQGVQDMELSPRSSEKDCRRVEDYGLDSVLEHPRRPLGFELSCGRVKDVKGDFTVEAIATGSESVGFEVRKPDAMDWFTVEPARGEVKPDAPLELKVKLLKDRMKDRRHYRGAFLVRTPEGLSRPVSFYAETDFVPPFRAEKPGETAVYATCEKAALGAPRTFSFDVPKKGRYYFLIHASSPNRKPNIKVGVDGAEPEPFRQQFTPYPSWVMLSPGGKFGNTIRFYDFAPGTHTVTVSGSKSITYDAVVLTDSPGSFEPR